MAQFSLNEYTIDQNSYYGGASPETHFLVTLKGAGSEVARVYFSTLGDGTITKISDEEYEASLEIGLYQDFIATLDKLISLGDVTIKLNNPGGILNINFGGQPVPTP